MPPTAIPAVCDLDNGGGLSSPLAPPRGASVDEAEGLAADAASIPVGTVGGGPSCADVSVGASPVGLWVGSSEGDAVPEAGSLLACEVASADEASVAVAVASVGIEVGDCSPLLALVSGLVVLSEVGTGASMGTCDSTVSTFTAELAKTKLTVRDESVGWAMEAEVVIPVESAAPEVIDRPRSEVGTRVA